MHFSDLEELYAQASSLTKMNDFVREHCGGLALLQDTLREVRQFDSFRNVLAKDTLRHLRYGLDSKLSFALALDGQNFARQLERSQPEQIRDLTGNSWEALVRRSGIDLLEAEHWAILSRSRYAKEPWYLRGGVDLSWLLPRSFSDLLSDHARLVASAVTSPAPERYKPPRSYDDRLKLDLTDTLQRVLTRWMKALRKQVDALLATLLHSNLYGPRFTVSIGQSLG